MKTPFKIFNTLSRKVEEFTPLKSGEVSIYTCGPTVYGYSHIGNYRTYIYEDVLVKYLCLLGYDVKRVMNITDVGHLTSDEDEGEDKLEVGAAREGITAWKVAEKYTLAFKEDLEILELDTPKRLVTATSCIEEQIDLIKELEEKGYTYRTSDGIYFDTSKFANYGELAQLDIEGLKAGSRVEFSSEKKNITDFALWKFSPKDSKRDMEWDSPWGVGFPGWHLECSAIIFKELGEQIDIHCGGVDHIPVHHVNEIAQSEAVSGKQFVKYWFHCEFLLVDGGKMSKSKNNIYTLEDLKRKGLDVLAFKLFVYQAGYRSKLNFTWDGLEAAQKRLYRWRSVVDSLKTMVGDNAVTSDHDNTEIEKFMNLFYEYMSDDLNIARVIALVDDVLNSHIEAGLKLIFIKKVDEVLSLDLLNQKNTSIMGRDVVNTDSIIDPEVLALVQEREIARQEKDFALADKIRKVLLERGYELVDELDGTKVLTKD